ncbi:RNA-binding S4 domain-containing protein [Aestuariispira insulae]|uniref:Heat shock protein Hsp15 n=1 Tax=Aestuariispira insulae TaxID=1461337 RepID=A0A3D9HE41_9PROT|nr:RNA-binding S4 domain-containing protein [Aestuariispira insulae]RED47730.1 heat shock protein Hsp15 [Aestuariispira insulae]
MSEGETQKLRLDKWLWYARFFKTRTLASTVVSAGHVRVNRQPIKKPGHMIKPGDVITFPQGPHIRVIEILGLSDRRGPAVEAQQLYNDLDPPQPRAREEQFDVARRDKGAGRPTKKERRDTDQLRSAW